jgi:hypothetical protein
MDRSSQSELRARLTNLRASLPYLPTVDHLLLQLAMDEVELRLTELEYRGTVRALATCRSALDRYSRPLSMSPASAPAPHTDGISASLPELAARISEIGFSHG